MGGGGEGDFTCQWDGGEGRFRSQWVNCSHVYLPFFSLDCGERSEALRCGLLA